MRHVFKRRIEMTPTDSRANVVMLCERLTAATVARTVEWRADGDDRYTWERDEGSVAIGARDRDGQPPYELAISNREGQRVEELASALVDDDLPADWNVPLAELYRVARRSALRADELIDALMAVLPPSTAGPASAEDPVVTVEGNE
jgi:hypothetical protein